MFKATNSSTQKKKRRRNYQILHHRSYLRLNGNIKFTIMHAFLKFTSSKTRKIVSVPNNRSWQENNNNNNNIKINNINNINNNKIFKATNSTQKNLTTLSNASFSALKQSKIKVRSCVEIKVKRKILSCVYFIVSTLTKSKMGETHE